MHIIEVPKIATETRHLRYNATRNHSFQNL